METRILKKGWPTFLVIMQVSSFYVQAMGPPRTNGMAVSPKVVQEGSQAALPCPIQADSESLYYEWYKDKEPWSAFSNQRMKILSSGTLRIKNTSADDNGLYLCRAINGFGSAEVNVTFIVLELEEYQKWLSSEEKAKGTNNYLEAPLLLNSTDANGPLKRELGELAKLKCFFTGRPIPSVTWYKDGVPMSKMLLPSPKKARWSLTLLNLHLSDSGNYTCVGRNAIGSANATFQIIVTDPKQSKPILSAIRPQNATVQEKNDLTLVCVVKSHLAPHIQWLHEVKDSDEEDPIVVMGEKYKVVKTSSVLERSNNLYLSKLIIQEVEVTDSGKYICLGANSMGYNYKSTYITVTPVSSQAFTESDFFTYSKILIIVTLISLITLVTGCLGYYMCIPAKEQQPPLNSNPSQIVRETNSHQDVLTTCSKSNTNSLASQNLYTPFSSAATTEKSVSSGNNSSCSCQYYSTQLHSPRKNMMIKENLTFPRRNPNDHIYNMDFSFDVV